MQKSKSEVGSKETIQAQDAAAKSVKNLKSGTTIPDVTEGVQPQAGTRQCLGKSNAPDAVLRTGKQPKAEAVRTVVCVDEAARRAIDIQVAGDDTNSPNGNPKRRTRNRWGTEDDKS